jgi:exodeoxyribonuclease V alpha subunit
LLASVMTRSRHAALDLEQAADRDLSEVLDCPKGRGKLPDYNRWVKVLKQCDAVGSPQHSDRPLILDNGLLYLNRFWHYETLVAGQIHHFSQSEPQGTDLDLARELLGKLFPTGQTEITNWQFVAAAATLRSGFTVITGGPGTGKTYTAARVLALHLGMKPDKVIRLAAPTGKAAQRLGEAIGQAKQGLDGILDPGLTERIPEEASTLHRLLGYHPGMGRFRFNSDNRLHVDMVIVDEASMIDLPLFAALFDALPDNASLVLLGDKDQLASVETGSVFHDLTRDGMVNKYDAGFVEFLKGLGCVQVPDGEDGGLLINRVVRLVKNHRVAKGSGIVAAAVLVNTARDRFERLVDVLKTGDLSRDEQVEVQQQTGSKPELPLAGLGWRTVRSRDVDETVRSALKGVLEGFVGYRKAVKAYVEGGQQTVMDALSRFRVLCAINEGDLGVSGMNRVFTRLMGQSQDGQPYHGRPVMVLHNDYGLGLMNGDVGVILETGKDLKAFFPGDGVPHSARPTTSLRPRPRDRAPLPFHPKASTRQRRPARRWQRRQFPRASGADARSCSPASAWPQWMGCPPSARPQ